MKSVLAVVNIDILKWSTSVFPLWGGSYITILDGKTNEFLSLISADLSLSEISVYLPKTRFAEERKLFTNQE